MDCAGVCLNDADADGVCDRWKCQGARHRMLATTIPLQPTKMEAVTSVRVRTMIIAYGRRLTQLLFTRTEFGGHDDVPILCDHRGEDDFVSAVYGNDMDTLIMASDSGWYQHPFGSHLAQNNDPAFFETFRN